MEQWERKKILILGLTYPSYSTKYDEVACTGGLLEGTFEMVRLHPVPHRYLDPANRFKSFQWITATVARHRSDPRPESLRIQPGSIVPGPLISPVNAGERVACLERSPHMCMSVEDLSERQKQNGTSLGIMKPKEILGCALETRSATERKEWILKEKEILGQQRLFGEEIKPIDFPETRFMVQWKCDDKRCSKPHSMGLLQWGLHELDRKHRDDPHREEKVLAEMRRRLDQSSYDVYLFLGNFRGVQFNFGLMDSYSAPRVLQPSLFSE